MEQARHCLFFLNSNIKYVNTVDGPFALLMLSILLLDINLIGDLFDEKRAQAKVLGVYS